MIIKKSLKITLSALLLAAGVSVYAQETEKKVVTLNDADKTPISWSDFVNALKNPPSGAIDEAIAARWQTADTAYTNAQSRQKITASKLPAAKKAYEDKNGELNGLQGTLQKKSNEYISLVNGNKKVLVQWLDSVNTALNSFANAWNDMVDNWDGESAYTTKGYVYYKTMKQGLTSSYNFFLYFVDESTETPSSEEWTRATETQLFQFLLAPKSSSNAAIKLAKFYIYLGTDSDGQYNYTATTNGCIGFTAPNNNEEVMNTDLMTNVTQSISTLTNNDAYKLGVNDSAIEKVEGELEEIQESIDAINVTKGEDGLTEIERLLSDYQYWDSRKTIYDQQVSDAKIEYDAAKLEYDQAKEESKEGALVPYQNVILTDDITTDETISSYSGVITGNKNGKPCIINYTGTGNLFTTLTGSLVNVAVNGKLAAASSGLRNSFANWDGETGVFVAADGNTRTECSSIGQLGYAARATYGIDFANEGSIVDLTEASKVYSITVYTSPEDIVPHFAQVSGNDFVTENGTIEIAETNTLVESADKLDLTNVFYNDGTKNYSSKIIIQDRQAFYSPKEIYAEKLTYNRQFNQDKNVACLPFAMDVDKNSGIEYLCTYYKESESKFFFKEDVGTIAANTPLMIVAKNSFKLENMSGITLQPTPAGQIVEQASLANDGSKIFGTFREATRDAFGDPETSNYKVYAMSSGTFKAANNVTIPSFRAVIHSTLKPFAGAPADRRIAILNRDGEDITEEVETAINGVKAEDSSLTVVGGQGVITITSEADHGQVPVYAIDGKTVATANVTEGTTTVNVKGGIYIVLGKKVLVK